jgi:hypothetical protein
MMAGYLVIRFIVMTAPVWATVATVPQAQGILRSAAAVAAAVVHPVIFQSLYQRSNTWNWSARTVVLS